MTEAPLTLGDMIAVSRRSSRDIEGWLAEVDGDLANMVRSEASARGEGVAQFIRIAVADFMAEADEEAWASLVSAIRGASDPGAACLARMTAFRVAMETAA